jgi:hypothetical protein
LVWLRALSLSTFAPVTVAAGVVMQLICGCCLVESKLGRLSVNFEVPCVKAVACDYR